MWNGQEGTAEIRIAGDVNDVMYSLLLRSVLAITVVSKQPPDKTSAAVERPQKRRWNRGEDGPHVESDKKLSTVAWPWRMMIDGQRLPYMLRIQRSRIL